MSEVLIKDIEKAKKEVKEFNKWHGRAYIMYDKDDGEIWTDIFTDDNGSRVYGSKNIIRVYTKGDVAGSRTHAISWERFYQNLLFCLGQREDGADLYG